MALSKKVIVSMTTIPVRKKRLIECLPSIRRQSFPFDKLVINVDDNLSEEDYKFYDSLVEQDGRIMINKSDGKWRSCNKLLPTIKLFPEDIIITVDDDIYYPVNCFKYLMEQYEKTPECIIAHEVQPITVNKGFISYKNGMDIKLHQVEWGKYMSNCCLFPPHVFDNTDLFDYDKMMACTNGTHDELWFWVNSTLNKTQCVGLNYIWSFVGDNPIPWEEGEYKLADINNENASIDDYMKVINDIYGTQLIEAIKSKSIIFTLNKDNVHQFILQLNRISELYNYGFKVHFDDLTNSWKAFVTREFKKIYN